MAFVVIGTAGHIDHGKTALVRALTGQDTDRLKEEKERGISIDLGFAYLEVPGVGRVGVVDVPGHERFIRNMLAGVHGIDLVLLTVAADDGVMPQTEEHLDILHMLGVSRGIVVITKADLVDQARIAAVREEIEILTVDTTLEGAPVIAVSVVDGAGLGELRDEIARQLATYERASPPGYFRLPVDRAFVMKGHGVVVTGTVVAGKVAAGETVRILPGGDTARVRSVEVHGRTVAEALFGQRAALNLAAVERADVRRGHVVSDERLSVETRCFDALVELRRGPRRSVKNHGRARVHLGTAETIATVVMLDGREALTPGARTYCQLRLIDPVMTLRGDRFILRTETAEATIGGGVVLHPFPPRHRRRDTGVIDWLRVLHEGEAGQAIVAFIELYAGFGCPREALVQAFGLREDGVRDLAVRAGGVLPIPDAGTPEAFTTLTKWDQLKEAARELVGSFHGGNPLVPGMEMESLRTSLPEVPDPKVFRWAIDRLVGQGVLARSESVVRLPEHKVALGERARSVGARIEARLRAAGLAPPDLRALETEGLSRRELTDVLGVLELEGRVVRVASDLYFAREAIEHGIRLLREYCASHGEIAAGTFRDLIGASRKYTIPLLQYYDRTGVTLRVGDVRKLR